MRSFTKADGAVVQLMLPAPALLQPGKTYCCSATIKGSESSCCEDCLEASRRARALPRLRAHGMQQERGLAAGRRPPARAGAAGPCQAVGRLLPPTSMARSAPSPHRQAVPASPPPLVPQVVVAGGIKLEFLAHESNNGTNEQRGQFPELYLRLVNTFEAEAGGAAAPAAAAAPAPAHSR
jgi:hypothetical protein